MFKMLVANGTYPSVKEVQKIFDKGYHRIDLINPVSQTQWFTIYGPR